MQKSKILLTIAIILSFSLSFIIFSQNKVNSKPILIANMKPSVDVDPPTTGISYTPVYPGNGYMLLNFDDQSLHKANNNLAHDIEAAAAPNAPLMMSNVSHSGAYSIYFAANISVGGGISWLWMKYSNYKIYQFSCWVYLTNNFTGGYINLIHTDFPSTTHAAMAYVEFQTDGHVHAINMMTLHSYDLGKYPLNAWFNATIIDLWNGQYRVYINSVDKGSYDDGGMVVNSFSAEAADPGMYIDDFQMNTPTSPASKNFVDSSTSFTLSTNDNDSDATTQYQIWDNTTSTMLQDWTVYSSSFTLGSSTNGTYSIVYDSSDDCGDESQKYENVYIDTIVPVTTLTFTPAHSPDFVNDSTIFLLSATDGNGSEIASGYPYYAWQSNGGAVHGPMPYTGPFELTGATNGTVLILYYSVDNIGNSETFNIAHLKIDEMAPISTISYTPILTIGSKNYVTTTTVFSLSATDVNGSGVASKYYNWTQLSINHATTAYTIPFMLTSALNGSCDINFWASDNVGNVETVNMTTVYVDKLPPTTVIHYKTAFAPNYVNSTTQFTLTANDNQGGTGVFMTFYRLNKASWHIYTNAFNLTGEGNNTVTINYYSIDLAGNIEYINAITVENSQHHVDVTIRYASSIDGWGVDYLEVFTYINGTELDVDTTSFYGSMIFNLTVKNVFDVAIYSHVYDASSTGPSLKILLPMTTLKVKNNFNYAVVFHLLMHNKELTFSLNPNDEFDPRVALGIYTWWITNSSDGAIIPAFKNNATTYFLEKITGSSPSINFGWYNAPPSTIINQTSIIDYIVFFTLIAVALGITVDVSKRVKAKATKLKSSNTGSSQPSHHETGGARAH